MLEANNVSRLWVTSLYKFRGSWLGSERNTIGARTDKPIRKQEKKQRWRRMGIYNGKHTVHIAIGVVLVAQ